MVLHTCDPSCSGGRRPRLENHKFEVSLDNLAKPCLIIRKEKAGGRGARCRALRSTPEVPAVPPVLRKGQKGKRRLVGDREEESRQPKHSG